MSQELKHLKSAMRSIGGAIEHLQSAMAVADPTNYVYYRKVINLLVKAHAEISRIFQ
jgi:hypothetical protein